MKKIYFVLLMVFLLAIVGCSKPKAECSSEQAQGLIAKIVTEKAEKIGMEQKFPDGRLMFDAAKIRATLSQIQISLDTVRTTSQDPNSTKKFCGAKIKFTVPTDIITNADKARAEMQFNTIAQYAQQLGFEVQANTFTKNIEYNIQPTDDGKELYGTVENVQQLAQLLNEFVSSSLIKSVVEAMKADKVKQEEKEKAEQAKLKETQNKATFDKAKADNDLARQTINELWKSLPEDKRKSLLEQQRAWVKKKEIDCKVEAASKSTDPTEKEIIRLMCDTNTTKQRIGELRQQI